MQIRLFLCLLFITFAIWSDAEQRLRQKRNSNNLFVERLRDLLELELQRREFSFDDESRSLERRDELCQRKRDEKFSRRKLFDFFRCPLK